MAKTIVKIANLSNLGRSVDISDDQQIMVRGLNLQEMVGLLVDSQDVFLPLYAAGVEGKLAPEQMAPFLLAAPEVVAKIIAMASDDLDSAPVVQQRMPATVQLIALSEIWTASVPDQKKARLLLSEVTALLQKLEEKAKSEQAKLAQQTPSPPSLLPQ